MIEIETEVIDVIARTPGVKSFRLESREDVKYRAGQFFYVTLKSGGKEMTKHFSFSSAPTEKGYVEFTKKLTRSDYSKALDQWKPGDRTRIKFPLGSFTLDESGKKIAFLSGGIGITPIRSMCRFATDERLSTDIVLLYGNATEKDIIFRDDFDAMERDNPNLRVVHTLTDESVDRNRWKGRTGFIDANMLREEIPDFAERTFYVCGPGAMVRTLSGQLTEELAVPDNRLKTEDFPGY